MKLIVVHALLMVYKLLRILEMKTVWDQRPWNKIIKKLTSEKKCKRIYTI